jgi:hypothetical protein
MLPSWQTHRLRTTHSGSSCRSAVHRAPNSNFPELVHSGSTHRRPRCLLLHCRHSPQAHLTLPQQSILPCRHNPQAPQRRASTCRQLRSAWGLQAPTASSAMCAYRFAAMRAPGEHAQQGLKSAAAIGMVASRAQGRRCRRFQIAEPGRRGGAARGFYCTDESRPLVCWCTTS